MQPVSIGGFHDNIVCIVYLLRVLDNWLVFIPDVAGKHKSSCNAVFLDDELYVGRAEQMPRVCKPRCYTFADLYVLAIVARC